MSVRRGHTLWNSRALLAVASKEFGGVGRHGLSNDFSRDFRGAEYVAVLR